MEPVNKTTRTSADHPLIGTWITQEQDSNVAFVLSVANGGFQVSGFCRSDGENFEITQIQGDGQSLTFVARMPSTGTTTRNTFSIRPDGKADLELTLYEIWKKKDVKPGEIPEAWLNTATEPLAELCLSHRYSDSPTIENMAATTHLMTVQEFRKLPENQGSVYHELRHGELVPVTRPKFKHHLIQSRLRDLFKALAPAGSVVEYEVAFRALPEHELRVADVAYINPQRAARIDPEDNVRGAPDLVIEILSPSNTVAEMYDKEKLCLENGAEEFWVVDTDRRQVKISTPDGHTITYQAGQEIPLMLSSEARIRVDEIFG